MQLTQQQLEEMVEGKHPDPNAVFFEQAVLNVPESHRQARRVYEKKLFVKLSQPGVIDTISYAAQPDDLKKYSNAYQYYLRNKQGKNEPGVEIIPNLDIAHLQELRDCGILTIRKLAEMQIVPPHLEYAHRSAQMLNLALTEMQKHGNETETVAAERSPFQYGGDVPTTDRLEHNPDVRSDLLPPGDLGASNRNPERHGTGGQQDINHPLNSGWDDWKIEFAPMR
jgi:hypothetical protein